MEQQLQSCQDAHFNQHEENRHEVLWLWCPCNQPWGCYVITLLLVPLHLLGSRCVICLTCLLYRHCSSGRWTPLFLVGAAAAVGAGILLRKPYVFSFGCFNNVLILSNYLRWPRLQRPSFNHCKHRWCDQCW